MNLNTVHRYHHCI